MGVQYTKPDTLQKNNEYLIRKQVLQSDIYIKNYPWIFDLEEQIINHQVVSNKIGYDMDRHIESIYIKLRDFYVFDTPYIENFHLSKYPIDLIVGLYSVHHSDLIIQLYFSDIFFGQYTLKPFVVTPLNRYILRFLFYGFDSIKIKYMQHSENMNSNVLLICCILDNKIRKDCVINSFM